MMDFEHNGEDRCKGCPIPKKPMYYDIESESYFTCSMCSCYDCPYLHNCDGQCYDER